MFENSKYLQWTLGVATAAIFSVGLGVSVGAVPQPGDDTTVHAGAVSPAAAQGADGGQTLPPSGAPTTTAATTPTTVAPPPSTAAPSGTSARARSATTASRSAAAGTGAGSGAGTGPATVARRTPSGAEVQAAIAGLKQRIGGLAAFASISPAQINQAGDQVCSGFDSGQSFAQVKATGLSMVPASVSVSPATVDWAVRTAVSMYCPGYASKLA